jgi:hypothetical protein
LRNNTPLRNFASGNPELLDFPNLDLDLDPDLRFPEDGNCWGFLAAAWAATSRLGIFEPLLKAE